jgi:hypothetical protein
MRVPAISTSTSPPLMPALSAGPPARTSESFTPPLLASIALKSGIVPSQAP